MKAAIYVRVSTTDQHIESQLYDLRELAAKREFEVVKEYQDCGVSGRKARRPGLDALIADARRKKFSVVLEAAFDRVARSVKHFLQVMDEFDSLGIVFISRRENVDTSGPLYPRIPTKSVPMCRWSPEVWMEVGRMQNADGSFLVGCLGSAVSAAMTCRFVATSPRESTTNPVPIISGNCGRSLRTSLEANATIDVRTTSNVFSKKSPVIWL